MSGEFAKVGVIGRSRQDGIEAVLADLLNAVNAAGSEVLLEDRFGDLTGQG